MLFESSTIYKRDKKLRKRLESQASKNLTISPEFTALISAVPSLGVEVPKTITAEENTGPPKVDIDALLKNAGENSENSENKDESPSKLEVEEPFEENATEDLELDLPKEKEENTEAKPSESATGVSPIEVPVTIKVKIETDGQVAASMSNSSEIPELPDLSSGDTLEDLKTEDTENDTENSNNDVDISAGAIPLETSSSVKVIKLADGEWKRINSEMNRELFKQLIEKINSSATSNIPVVAISTKPYLYGNDFVTNLYVKLSFNGRLKDLTRVVERKNGDLYFYFDKDAEVSRLIPIVNSLLTSWGYSFIVFDHIDHTENALVYTENMGDTDIPNNPHSGEKSSANFSEEEVKNA